MSMPQQVPTGSAVPTTTEMTAMKDVAVWIPVCATALALLYDVGFFLLIGANFISLFSLSEHAVFALEALPFTFAGAIFVIGSPISYEAGLQRSVSLAQDKKKERRLYAYVMSGVGVVMAGLFVWRGWWGNAAMTLFGFGYLALRERSPLWFTSAVSVSLLAVAVAMTAFIYGAQQAYLLRTSVPTTIQTLTLQTGEQLKGILVRSGEKILLFQDAGNRTMTVFKWEDVKTLSSP